MGGGKEGFMLRLLLLCLVVAELGAWPREGQSYSTRDKCVQIVCHLSIFTSGVSR